MYTLTIKGRPATRIREAEVDTCIEFEASQLANARKLVDDAGYIATWVRPEKPFIEVLKDRIQEERLTAITVVSA